MAYNRKVCGFIGCPSKPTHVVWGRYASVRVCCEHFEEPRRQIIGARPWPKVCTARLPSVALRRPAHQCDTDGEPKMVELPGWYRLNVDARTVRAWQSDMDKEYGTRTGKWSRHYHPVPTCSVCGEAMEVGE